MSRLKLFRYGINRFYHVAAGKGSFGAACYAFEHIRNGIRNFFEELKSRIEGYIFTFAPGLRKDKKINTVTFSEFQKIKREDNYYRGRWRYFKEVINIVQDESPARVLELGPRRSPIVKGSDVMDINIHGEKPAYVHDAGNIPWPVDNDRYDLFIGLQVWEHLENNQTQAFKEVTRVSKAAVLSFPYKRYSPGDCHHDIDEKRIAEWTLNIKPAKITKAGPVIIYFFKFQQDI